MANKIFSFSICLCMIVVMAVLLLPACNTPSPESVPTPAKPIELIFATYGPKTHSLVAVSDEWMAEIEKRTNNRVKFIPHYGASLLTADAQHDGVVKRITDISGESPSYMKGRFPVAECLELPWGYPDGKVATQVICDVIDKFKPPELSDVHFLYATGSGNPVIITNKLITTIEDMKGLKIRSSGTSARIVEQLGAAAVSMPMTECYDAIKKGVADGTIGGTDVLKIFKMAEIVKYALNVNCIASTTVYWDVMNIDKWNALPKDIQNIFTELSEKYIPIRAEGWDRDNSLAADYARGVGVKFNELSAQEQARWKAAMKPIIDSYINSLQAKGLPGKEIASFIEERISKYSTK